MYGSPPFIKFSEKYKWNVRTVRGTMGSGKFEVSVEFFMEYSVILQRFPSYSTYKGFNFIDERSTVISSNEWRNTYEPISYRKIYNIKEKTEKSNTGTISREAWCFQ